MPVNYQAKQNKTRQAPTPMKGIVVDSDKAASLLELHECRQSG
jgi:hypothetical protein